MKAFFDSNILIYAFSTDYRRERAIEVIALGGKINVQVLNEFTNVMLKKQKLSWTNIELAITAVNRLFPDIQSITPVLHSSALRIARRHKLSFYDALIVAAAIAAECEVLFSEDMQDGQKFSGLQVINPFVGK